MLTNIARDRHLGSVFRSLTHMMRSVVSAKELTLEKYSLQFSVECQERFFWPGSSQILPRASDVKEPFSFALRSCRLDYKTMTNEPCKQALNWSRENSSAFYFD
jgi:hypothetical protein